MLRSVQMPTEHIVAMLIQERDKLNRALEALTGSQKRKGRPPKSAAAQAPSVSGHAGATQKRRGMSAANRKEHSERMKAYWAKKRKGKS